MITDRTRRAVLFSLSLACGFVVFNVFSHYYPMFTGKTDIVGRVVTAVVFLVAALYARRTDRFEPYWRVLYAFFVGLTAISLDFYLGLSKWIVPALGMEIKSPAGVAIDKLESSLLGIAAVMLLVRASGDSLGSLYLRRGRLRAGLTVGLVALVVVVATLIPVGQGLFGGRNLSWVRIMQWTPWLIIFVLANGFNEELLYRGLFFGRLEPHLGMVATNVVMAIPFTLMHTGVRYAPAILPFLSFLFLLSLAWGHTLQKTDSIWGSILFHAATDIYVAVSVFSNLS